MSEILIKGMELPKSCGECRASGTDVCRKWMGKKNLKVRSENCPLVELPPHGDLIDRSKLSVIPITDYKLEGHLVVEIEDIENAPTILEASEVKV